jgi:hypothetical protein
LESAALSALAVALDPALSAFEPARLPQEAKLSSISTLSAIEMIFALIFIQFPSSIRKAISEISKQAKFISRLHQSSLLQLLEFFG